MEAQKNYTSIIVIIVIKCFALCNSTVHFHAIVIFFDNVKVLLYLSADVCICRAINNAN